ncbi:MAG TPA: ABC transporter ATP-binding protein [Gammaproteobacteria bacterium]|nr:ABC transporter ATP-binding protein [Gammaproteobacteria bacterium]
MLELSGVHAHYGLSHVLQGVDLTVGEREMIGLFGRNGVGKTTIMKTIAGWLRPTTGTITLEGRRLDGLRSERIARQGVAYVPEDRRIFPGLTVEENLSLGLLQRRGIGRAEGRKRLQQIFDRFPRLADRRRQAGTTLSGGEQQMLTIARALVGSPRLLLIDEPSEGLAPMIVDEIFAILDDLRTQGVAVILVEQNVYRAFSLVDRYYAIERGSVILSGAGGESGARDQLMEAIAV